MILLWHIPPVRSDESFVDAARCCIFVLERVAQLIAGYSPLWLVNQTSASGRLNKQLPIFAVLQLIVSRLHGLACRNFIMRGGCLICLLVLTVG